MGTAWAASLAYPWEQGYYVGGIETVKVNIMLRIYANKWHVYAGLAILNPSARVQIDQYAASTTDLFKLMLAGDRRALRERLYKAREKVFVDSEGAQERPTILLSEDILDRFSLGKKPQPGLSPISPVSAGGTSSSSNNANSHLSLLAMVDCWAALGIHPFVHLALAATPLFRLWIGVAEYLFRSTTRLDAAIEAALRDVSHRADDLEFVVAARGWSQAVRFGSFDLYRERFEQTAEFFRPRFAESARLGGEMIRAIQASNGENGRSAQSQSQHEKKLPPTPPQNEAACVETGADDDDDVRDGSRLFSNAPKLLSVLTPSRATSSKAKDPADEERG